jgi:type IV secretion system protein VirD4
LNGSDFSMTHLCDPNRRLRVQIIIPIEYVELWAPAIRLLIGSAIQAKLRDITAPPVSILIDECGQLGHFTSVRELYTFGRGAKLSGLCAWQEISQAYQAFGEHGANEIVGSAQFRVFKGIRTLETARLVSAMAGSMTLHYDSHLEQSNARRLRRAAMHRIFAGADPHQVASEIRHYRMAETHRAVQARQLFSPDEVLNLPASQMIAFASGLVEGPIVGHWPMYFERRDLAGTYLPNPYHDPHRVRISTRWGSQMVGTVTEPVPDRLAHLPQYRSGTWSYIKGYRPKLK